MKEKIILDINPEVVLLIEKIDLECQSRRQVIQHILSKNLMDIETEAFKNYQLDYDKKFYEFTILKQELEKNIIFPYTNNKRVPWNLDYITKVLTFERDIENEDLE